MSEGEACTSPSLVTISRMPCSDWAEGGTKTVWGLRVLPDVLVGDGEGLAERLGRVEPDCRILLSRYRRLSRNRSRAHVQSAGDGRQQGVVTRIWTDTCPMRERDQEMGQRSRQAEGLDSSCCWRPTLQSFGQVHGTQDLLCDVWWPQTFQPLLPKQLQTDRQLFIWSSHWFLISFACSFSRHFQI